jgi:hypothetical protein
VIRTVRDGNWLVEKRSMKKRVVPLIRHDATKDLFGMALNG